MLTLVAVISFAAGALASDTADADCVFDESLLSREIDRFTSRDPEVFKVNKSIENGEAPSLMWEALKCLNDLMDKYSNVTSAIRWLKKYHGDKLGKTFEITLEHMVKAPADKYWTIACVRGNFSVIVLNKIYFGQGFDEEIKESSYVKGCGPGWTFRNVCKREVDSRYWCYCEEKDYIKSIISHEFGHVVEMVFACLVKYDDSRPEYAEYHGKSFDEICMSVLKHIVYEGSKDDALFENQDPGSSKSAPVKFIPYDTFAKEFKLPESADESLSLNSTLKTAAYSDHAVSIEEVYNRLPGTAKENAREFFAEMFALSQCYRRDWDGYIAKDVFLAIKVDDFITRIMMPAIPDEHSTVVRGVISGWRWLTSLF